jgi:hypothetical protein
MALIVVGSGLRLYREYQLRSIGSRYRVHLLLSAEPGWEREYVDGWTVLDSTGDVAELTTDAGILRALRESPPGRDGVARRRHAQDTTT